MDYEIEIREIEPVRVAYRPYCGIATEASKAFPGVFQAIRGRTAGAPFFSYLEMNPETKMGVMELCVPTDEVPDGGGTEVKEIPGARAVCTTHTGSYESLNQAYAAIDRYAAENGIRLQPPFRED